jgi:hypothetical protein
MSHNTILEKELRELNAHDEHVFAIEKELLTPQR